MSLQNSLGGNGSLLQESTTLSVAVSGSAVSLLLILTLTAIIVFAVWRLKLKKQEPKDVEASGGNIYNAGKQRTPQESINLAPNHTYASINVPKCKNVPVYPNEVYAICSKTKKPRGLEVNTAPNKAYAVSNVPRCAKIPVYPNEVYAVSKAAVKEEPVYELAM